MENQSQKFCIDCKFCEIYRTSPNRIIGARDPDGKTIYNCIRNKKVGINLVTGDKEIIGILSCYKERMGEFSSEIHNCGKDAIWFELKPVQKTESENVKKPSMLDYVVVKNNPDLFSDASGLDEEFMKKL